MHELNIDIETYSPEPLRKTGVHRYAEHPDFELLLLGYSLNGSEPRVVDVAQGERIPAAVVKAIFDPRMIKRAYNAAFEIACLSAHFGRPLDPSQWRCTSVLALTLGLPGPLAEVARALRLPAEQQKARTGRALISYFCVPCRPTRVNGGRLRNLPHHAPDKWALFKDYCRQDVIAEMAIGAKLVRWPPNGDEQALWALDQAINTRGIRVDRELIDAAIALDAGIKAARTAEFAALTGIAKATQVAQLKRWLSDEHDVTADSLNKTAIGEILAARPVVAVERALQLRQELSKSSVAKYVAMRASCCADDRLRGLLQFYGANRTGRWAGRIVQMQNLPRSDLSHADLDRARDLVKKRDVELLEILYGPVSSLLSQLIRAALIPADGCTFVVVDFAAIEARVLAWAADEKWRLEVFRTHGRIYEASASQMFKVPIETIGKHSPLRQKGKVAELACIAEGQLVLTDIGLVPIEDVTREMRVWDGERFVEHCGVVYRGMREVMCHDGLVATPDHVVWTEDGELQLSDAASRGQRLVQSGSGRYPIRVGRSHEPGKEVHPGLERFVHPDKVHGLRFRAVAELSKLGLWALKGLSGVFSAKSRPNVAVETRHGHGAEMPEPKGRRVQELRGSRYPVRVQLGTVRGAVDSGDPWTKEGSGAGQTGQRRALRAGEYPVPVEVWADAEFSAFETHTARRRLDRGEIPPGDQHVKTTAVGRVFERTDRDSGGSGCPGSAKELASNSIPSGIARVYDLLDCGPLNRFTVADRLVHNCGYHGGVGALVSMGALSMGLAESDLPGIISAWRAANPNIMSFGYAMEKHAKQTLRSRVPTGVPGRYRFRYERGFLFLALPSGRELAYANARIEASGGYNNIVYDGLNQETKRWEPVETYAGKLLENYTQAIARDCLACALTALEKKGLQVVGHVHDEALLEIDLLRFPDPRVALRLAEQIFSRPLLWAPGLPLKGDGFVSDFYRKDA